MASFTKCIRISHIVMHITTLLLLLSGVNSKLECLMKYIGDSDLANDRVHDAARAPVYAGDDEQENLRHFEKYPTISTRIVTDCLRMLRWQVWFTAHHHSN